MTTNDNKSEVISSYEAYTARVGKEIIPCYEPAIGQEELALITDVINRNWLSESKYTRQFEAELASACQRKHAVCFNNATAALISGMKALGIKTGDEVIVPSFAHSADPNSIVATDAIPVFADIEAATLCLSVETIKAVKTAKTKAILLISAYGNVGAIEQIANYAQANNLFLINDCAPALFGHYQNKPIASYGDFSVLSFFADKTITTGEGGMMLSDNLELINEANMYKHDGRKERGVDIIDRRGYNFRITELQSAVGVAQLKKAPFFIKRKKEILQAYRNKLKGVEKVRVFEFNPGGDIVPHRVVIFVPAANPLIDYLSAAGIGARTMFMPMHSQPAYRDLHTFPVTEEIYKTGICLPSAPSLTAEQLEFVCQTINNFYQPL
ncbi:MAG: hypothetical protein A3J93_01105 [Candidatus Magasanikbacteria bacterium RIFOXYC2_FULL_42_28]|uniref:DegT/DnrJ/EryC1/StrS aminotransferase n=1 Tax=Candidatus Magasanikbacteria bacterium RIFOXYC2_FULL_42_28 TaxID=1798704 RepID=A0A1F6NXL4_9BACT|nr:MAG: hypothetical protein A3J93_01105 [Candidatus Magasanikbacteria bacterium RIFOXYC2_FULL_42_28]